MLEEHLGERTFLVAERYTIADISLYGYTHTAPDAGFDLAEFPAVAAWLRRVEQTPRFVNDLQPYPANAAAGAGRSIYG
jgi:glutathione S-transferase